MGFACLGLPIFKMSSVSQESSLLETEFPLVILPACPSVLWSVKAHLGGGVCALGLQSVGRVP